MSRYVQTAGRFFHHTSKGCISVLILAGLAGCAAVTPPLEQAALGIDGIACVGRVATPPEGLVAADDKTLLLNALGSSGAGKLCDGKVFVAIRPVTVYRVWNSEKRYTLTGSWWSFTQPVGPVAKYREENAICPSWSSLNRMSACTIKVGTKIVAGPGQSADCAQDQIKYPKSAVNQVYIPNDARNNAVFVEDCTEGTDWP